MTLFVPTKTRLALTALYVEYARTGRTEATGALQEAFTLMEMPELILQPRPERDSRIIDAVAVKPRTDWSKGVRTIHSYPDTDDRSASVVPIIESEAK